MTNVIHLPQPPQMILSCAVCDESLVVLDVDHELTPEKYAHMASTFAFAHVNCKG